MKSEFIFYIFGIKIKIKTNKNYLKKYWDYSFFNFYNVIKLIKDTKIFLYQILRKKHKYKIIPFGEYCFPRCITTFSHLKPRKRDGEKTLPFDLAHHKLDKVIETIDTDFRHFFDDIEYDSVHKWWENKSLNAIYNHEKTLTKEQFIQLYKKRISNFYEYINEKDCHIFVLIASFNPVSEETVIKAKNLMKKFKSEKDYDIIIINQSKEYNNIKIPNVYIINQCHNVEAFNKINEFEDWNGQIKTRNNKLAQKVYYDAVQELMKIIK